MPLPDNSSVIAVSAATARHLLMDRQGLCDSPTQKLSNSSLLKLITRMGFVQIDSIKTVERAHHMILFSRNQTYKQHQLDHLLEQDRSLFEHWTHDASIVPTQFYPYWRRRIKRDEPRLLQRWSKFRNADYKKDVAPVMRHIRKHGDVMSRDLKTTPKGGAGGWWEWHPSKTALEFLWHNGKLAVSRRVGFQKVYDLAERVIDESHFTSLISNSAYVDWACRAALQRLGMATVGEIAAFWAGVTIAEVKTWIARQSKDVLVTVDVQSVDGSAAKRSVALRETLEQRQSLGKIPARIRLLSPFDPVIRDRKRCLRLFGFDYRIEVFVPASQRRYGYYVFPLLEKDRLVGRIDCKSDRQASCLNVSGLWWEPNVRVSRSRVRALESELERVRRFVDLDTVRYASGVNQAMTPD